MASNIEIIVTAKDEATRVLQVVQRQMEIFPEFARTTTIVGAGVDRTTQSLQGFEFSATKAARAIRSLAAPIASELSPALGTMGSQLASVITAAAAVGSGFGALAIGGATLAGILGGKLVQSWRESAAAAESYARAVRAGDIAALTQAVSTQADEVIRLSREYRELATAAARARQEAAGGGPEAAGVAGAASFFAADAGKKAEEKRQELLAKQREVDLAKQSQGEAAALLQAERDLKKIEEDRAALRFANTLADRGLGDFRFDPVQQAFRAQLRQAEDRANAGDPVGAARLRQNAVDVRQFALGARFAAGAPVNPFETAEGQEAERRAREGLVVTEEAEREARIRAFQAGAPVNPFETEAGQEAERRAVAALVLKDEAERLATLSAQRQEAVGLLEVTRARLELTGQLTPELAAQLAIQQAQAIAADENLKPWERSLVLAQGTTAAMAEMAKLDPLGGLVRGFSGVANEARQLGTELERFARETGSNMERAFSDTFFDAFTGKKGEDIGKRFGESLLRSFTDLLGRQLSGAASGIFAQALRSFSGASGAVAGAAGGSVLDLLSAFTGGGGGLVVSPTGAPAGTLITTAGGQLAQVMPSGALQLVQGGQGGGGGGGLPFDVSTVLGGAQQLYGGLTTGFAGITGLVSNYAIGGITGALLGLEGATVGGATVVGAAGTTGFLAAEVAATGTGTAVGASAGTTGLIGTGGSLFGSTAGAATAGVLAGIALGFTIYSGLAQEPTAVNIALNTVSGAISGAILGAAIGSAFGPGPGTLVGGVIGAIAGGAAAGGTTGIKAPPGRMTTSEKSRKIGELASNNLVNAIRGARSIEDLVTIMNTQWSPHGEVQILTTYQGVTYWAGDYDDPPGAAATPELMVIPEFLDQLVIQVGESGAPQRRQDLIDEFKAKRNELLGILAEVPFAILETDPSARVSRRTYLPLTQLYGLKPGTQQLAGSSELYRRDLGADDDTIAFLIDRIREVSIRKDIDLTREDFLFR